MNANSKFQQRPQRISQSNKHIGSIDESHSLLQMVPKGVIDKKINYARIRSHIQNVRQSDYPLPLVRNFDSSSNIGGSIDENKLFVPIKIKPSSSQSHH